MKYTLTILIMILSICAFAFNVSTNAPGNLYYSNENIVISSDASIKYTIENYYGEKIKDGEITGNIAIELKDPCWYIAKFTDGVSEKELYISVIPKRIDNKIKSICVDSAAVHLVKRENIDKYCQILAKSDIDGVRERFYWHSYQPNKETMDYSHYDYLFKAYEKYGIDLYQMNSQTPEWNRIKPTQDGAEDLRYVYNYFKNMSVKYPEVSGWEVWNEPELSGFKDNSDKLSGIIKAGYLGMKAGNPKALGLGASMCAGMGMRFNKDLLECGYMNYIDRFNWHFYSEPEQYVKEFNIYNNEILKQGYSLKPTWITEAGIRLIAEKNGNLSFDNMKKQCEFMPQSNALAMASGNERIYNFVAPYYLENIYQFGFMTEDFNLYPAFLSLSTAAHFLGDATYLGKYGVDPKVECRIFKKNNTFFAIVWGDGKISLPAKDQITVYNMFGKKVAIKSINESNIDVLPETQYVFNLDESILKKLTVLPLNIKEIKQAPNKTVVMGYLNDKISKEMDYYLIESNEFKYVVDLYNFDEKKSTKGNMKVELPKCLSTKDKTIINNIEIEPMGRKRFEFNLKVEDSNLDINKISVSGSFDNKKLSPCVTYIKNNAGNLGVDKIQIINFKERVKLTSSNNSKLSIIPLENEGFTYLFDVEFPNDTGKWAYPYIELSPGEASDYDAFAVDIEYISGAPDTEIRALYSTTDGKGLMGTAYKFGDATTFIYPFSEATKYIMEWGKTDTLDKSKIKTLSFGLNGTSAAVSDHIKFKFKNPRFVKFK